MLSQQIARYAARSAELRAEGEQRVQRVNLHLALGGDFGAMRVAPPEIPVDYWPFASKSDADRTTR